MLSVSKAKSFKTCKAAELAKNIREHYVLYLLALPAVAYYIIFCYGPMYGVQIAFKSFNGALGIWGSPWCGLENFQRFLNSSVFMSSLRNTLSISVYSLLASFPVPIILALMLNEVRLESFKKTIQMVTYAPHFISTVVLAGMILIFLESPNGLVNQFISLFGLQPVDFMARENMFNDIYVWSGVWQGMGWGSILYISALSGIDPLLHEAAVIDGANKLRRIWHIDIPGIMPVIVIQFILQCGSILSVGFEKVFLLQNSINIARSEVISTYTYKMGIGGGDFSFSTAVGLFNSLINFALLLTVNFISKKVGDVGLW